MKKVNFGESRSNMKSAKGVPFAITYHPRLKALGKSVDNYSLSYMKDKLKDTFTLGLMVSFRISQNVFWLEVLVKKSVVKK